MLYCKSCKKKVLSYKGEINTFLDGQKVKEFISLICTKRNYKTNSVG